MSRILSTLVTCFMGCIFLSGCQTNRLDHSRYGYTIGKAGESVQGTRLLADIFADHGYRISTATTLGRTIDRADVVVWCPDRLELPGNDVIDFFEGWLSGSKHRTLVYVGRDFSPPVAYWDGISALSSSPDVTPEERKGRSRSRALATVEWEQRRASADEEESCRWFQVKRHPRSYEATDLSGPWAKGWTKEEGTTWITSDVSIHVDSDFYSSQRLLWSGENTQAIRLSRLHWKGNGAVVFANGASLLNWGMVQQNHRRVAERLVEECGPSGRVVFLTSGASDPMEVRPSEQHYLLRVFTTAPLQCILMHLSVLGILYCIHAFPHLGRPKRITATHTSDFGLHVAALGRLMRRTGDKEFAESVRRDYLQQGHESRGNPFLQEDTGDEDTGDEDTGDEDTGDEDTGDGTPA